MISANDLRNGMFVRIDGELFMAVESQHYKPGKGGALVRTKLKNLKIGSVIDRTFRAEEAVEEIFIEEKKYQYLYFGEGEYHFMDNQTFEQMALPEEEIGEAKRFLKENAVVTFAVHEGKIINIKLPTFIDLKVVETEPGVRGDTVKAGTKSAKLETGSGVQVPLFINTGDIIRIDTRTGKYMGRV